MNNPDPATAGRDLQALFPMTKLNIAELEKAAASKQAVPLAAVILTRGGDRYFEAGTI